MAIYGKEYVLDKFSLEKSVNKHCQPKKQKNPGEVEESDDHIIYSKCPEFFKN